MPHPINYLFVLLTLLLSMSGLRGQDARFSQFYLNPLQLNPAMTGVFPGKTRVALNYRSLYSSILNDQAYRTFSAGVDMRFPSVGRDYLGVGISFLRDEAGLSRFNRTSGQLGLAYLKQISGSSRYNRSEQFLVAGGQVGFGQRGFEWDQLWFSRQFDPNAAAIDRNSPSGESFPQEPNSHYLDLHAGLLWYAVFRDDASIYAGGAVHHFNAPEVSFFENETVELYRRWTVHAGGQLPVTEELSLLPALAFITQGPATSTTGGVNFRYTNRQWREAAVRIGIWGHLSQGIENSLTTDAIVITTIIETERWNIGASYDITASSLTDANNSRGAYEFSLMYTLPEKRRYQVKCPNF